MGLTGTWNSPVPDSFAIFRVRNHSGIESVCVDALLDLEILFNGDESFIHTLLCSELKDLLVTVSSGALNVLPCWLKAELPRTFQSCGFFKTVVTSSIIDTYGFEMGLWIMLLESSQSFPRLLVV